MGFNLNERKREIGILKTLGFSERQLLLSMSLEAGLLGFLGALGEDDFRIIRNIISSSSYWDSNIHINSCLAIDRSDITHYIFGSHFGIISRVVCSL